MRSKSIVIALVAALGTFVVVDPTGTNAVRGRIASVLS